MLIISIFFLLLTIAIIYAIMLYVLMEKKISFGEALQLICLSRALNRLLFSGSGYLAGGYLFSKEKVSFLRLFSSLLAIEFISVLFLTVIAFFSGVTIIKRMPISLAISIMIFILIIFLFKRKKLKLYSIKFLEYARKIKTRIFLIVPLVVLNIFLLTLYYSMLLKIFNIFLPLKTVFQLMAISFVIGYFSPAPAGLGFKETGLVFMLKQQSVALSTAIYLAFWDRLIITIFWLGMALITAAGFLKKELYKKIVKSRLK